MPGLRGLPGLRGRRLPDPLGDGVWRAAHDRFLRAVQRYHQVIAPVPAGPLGDRLTDVAQSLNEQLVEVGRLCAAAQRQAPSAGRDVPAGPGGRFLDVHRALSRSGGMVAQAAQAAAMARACLSDDPPAAIERAVAAAGSADRASRELTLAWAVINRS